MAPNARTGEPRPAGRHDRRMGQQRRAAAQIQRLQHGFPGDVADGAVDGEREVGGVEELEQVAHVVGGALDRRGEHLRGDDIDEEHLEPLVDVEQDDHAETRQPVGAQPLPVGIEGVEKDDLADEEQRLEEPDPEGVLLEGDEEPAPHPDQDKDHEEDGDRRPGAEDVAPGVDQGAGEPLVALVLGHHRDPLAERDQGAGTDQEGGEEDVGQGDDPDQYGVGEHRAGDGGRAEREDQLLHGSGLTGCRGGSRPAWPGR